MKVLYKAKTRREGESMPTCSVCGKEVPAGKLLVCSECGKTFCEECADTSMRALGLCSDCEETWQAEDDLDADDK
jgi:predicted amidophosphoribosyltransferase